MVLGGIIGADEVLLALGLSSVAYGCWQVWEPAAWIVPGGVLIWIAMPVRRAFIERPPPEAARRKS